jgi:predicted nuclease of restriction endonuclease-like RecB superfamily
VTAKRIGTRVGAYRSKFEDGIAAQLQDAGVPFEYEAVRLPYERPCVYVPDFMVITTSGKTVYIEAKGYFPPADRRKMLEVKRAHPDADIRLVFQKPGMEE